LICQEEQDSTEVLLKVKLIFLTLSIALPESYQR
jgi:hypothetical protein